VRTFERRTASSGEKRAKPTRKTKVLGLMKQRESDAREATKKAKAKATAERIGSDIRRRLLKCSTREAKLSIFISMLLTPIFMFLYLTERDKDTGRGRERDTGRQGETERGQERTREDKRGGGEDKRGERMRGSNKTNLNFSARLLESFDSSAAAAAADCS
jgi:hypothetical protein